LAVANKTKHRFYQLWKEWCFFFYAKRVAQVFTLRN
jgi:hypothetical protein